MAVVAGVAFAITVLLLGRHFYSDSSRTFANLKQPLQIQLCVKVEFVVREIIESYHVALLDSRLFSHGVVFWIDALIAPAFQGTAKPNLGLWLLALIAGFSDPLRQ